MVISRPQLGRGGDLCTGGGEGCCFTEDKLSEPRRLNDRSPCRKDARASYERRRKGRLNAFQVKGKGLVGRLAVRKGLK